jgi:hypothetical protein
MNDLFEKTKQSVEGLKEFLQLNQQEIEKFEFILTLIFDKNCLNQERAAEKIEFINHIANELHVYKDINKESYVYKALRLGIMLEIGIINTLAN